MLASFCGENTERLSRLRSFFKDLCSARYGIYLICILIKSFYFIFSSVVDLDPDWIPGSGSRTPKKRKKVKIILFSKCWMFSFEG